MSVGDDPWSDAVAQELRRLGFGPGVHPAEFVTKVAALRCEQVVVQRTASDIGPGVFALLVKDSDLPHYAILVHPNDPLIEARSMWHEAAHYYLRHPLHKIFVGAQECLGHRKGWIVADEYDAEAEAWGVRAYHFSLGIGADSNLALKVGPEKSDEDDPFGEFMGWRFSMFLKGQHSRWGSGGGSYDAMIPSTSASTASYSGSLSLCSGEQKPAIDEVDKSVSRRS